jgi:hypothetical protein
VSPDLGDRPAGPAFALLELTSGYHPGEGPVRKDRAFVVLGLELVPEDGQRPRAVVHVDHPTTPVANPTEASITRLVDGDQARGEVSCVATEMP